MRRESKAVRKRAEGEDKVVGSFISLERGEGWIVLELEGNLLPTI